MRIRILRDDSQRFVIYRAEYKSWWHAWIRIDGSTNSDPQITEAVARTWVKSQSYPIVIKEWEV